MLQKGEWDQAITLYQSALEADAGHVGAHVNLGCALAMKGQDKTGLEKFKKALDSESSPYKAFILFNIGAIQLREALVSYKAEAYQEAGLQFKEASEFLLKAAELLPGTETVPGFLGAVDWGNQAAVLSEMAPSTTGSNFFHRVEFSMDSNGLLPDTGRFLKPATSSEGSGVYIFDAQTYPALYFYRSPNVLGTVALASILKGDLEEAERDAKQGLSELEAYPAERPDNAAKLNLLVALAQIAISRESWDQADELLSQARELDVNKAQTEGILLAVLFQKGDYSKLKTLSAEVLKRDPNHQVALLAKHLQFDSPNVQPDGTYTPPSGKFSLKKPKKWIVWDQQTNADGFKHNVPNPSRTPVYFTEDPFPDTALVMLTLEPLTTVVSEQEAMARLNSSIAQSMAQAPKDPKLKTEGPKEIHLNGKNFFWYRWDRLDPNTGAVSAVAYWIFFAGDRLYTFMASGPPDRCDPLFSVAEEIAGSLEVIR